MRGHDLKTRPKITCGVRNEDETTPTCKFGQHKVDHGKVEDMPEPIRRITEKINKKHGAKNNTATLTFYANGTDHHVVFHQDRRFTTEATAKDASGKCVETTRRSTTSQLAPSGRSSSSRGRATQRTASPRRSSWHGGT